MDKEDELRESIIDYVFRDESLVNRLKSDYRGNKEALSMIDDMANDAIESAEHQRFVNSQDDATTLYDKFGYDE